MNQNQAVYLFYLTLAATGPPPEMSIEGEGPILAHHSGDLAGIVSLVSIDEFCGPEAERRLKDVEWVSTRAVRHEKVVEEGWRRAPVLPCRFATLFSSFDSLDRFIDANRSAVHEFLNQVREEQEWILKVLVDHQAVRRWLERKHASDTQASASPGMQYLRQRRALADADKRAREWLGRECEEVAQSFDEYVTRRRQRAISDPAGTEDNSHELALSLALLVPQKRTKRLEAHVDAINRERNEQGLVFQVTGPWPPYSFCPALEMPA